MLPDTADDDGPPLKELVLLFFWRAEAVDGAEKGSKKTRLADTKKAMPKGIYICAGQKQEKGLLYLSLSGS